MSKRHAIILSVDGLRASALGAYGNTWHATPALDALAAQAVVVDWMWCETIELASGCLLLWGGGADSLPRRLAAAGTTASLVTDDVHVAQWADAAGFADVWRVECDANAPASEIADTVLARVFAAATERLASWSQDGADASRLLWIHARGFRGPWDAPQQLRAELLQEEGDPAPPAFVDPPRLMTDDHDVVLACRAAYAAQAIVLDECVGGLMTALSELDDGENSLVALFGCRGYALGEHGAVGDEQSALYGELLHVPCLLRVPQLAPAPPRLSGLAQLADVEATLASWFQLPRATTGVGQDLLACFDGDALPRQFVCAVGAGDERALRTPAWMLRRREPTDAERAVGSAAGLELYAKPDDRWEANEVADRCAAVAERLLAALQQCERTGASTLAVPLDADLVEPSR